MRVSDKMITRPYREVIRYVTLTVLVTGGVLLGDLLSGKTVSLSHALVLLLFTSVVCVSGVTIKVIWSRRTNHRSESK